MYEFSWENSTRTPGLKHKIIFNVPIFSQNQLKNNKGFISLPDTETK